MLELICDKMSAQFCSIFLQSNSIEMTFKNSKEIKKIKNKNVFVLFK